MRYLRILFYSCVFANVVCSQCTPTNHFNNENNQKIAASRVKRSFDILLRNLFQKSAVLSNAKTNFTRQITIAKMSKRRTTTTPTTTTTTTTMATPIAPLRIKPFNAFRSMPAVGGRFTFGFNQPLRGLYYPAQKGTYINFSDYMDYTDDTMMDGESSSVEAAAAVAAAQMGLRQRTAINRRHPPTTIPTTTTTTTTTTTRRRPPSSAPTRQKSNRFRPFVAFNNRYINPNYIRQRYNYDYDDYDYPIGAGYKPSRRLDPLTKNGQFVPSAKAASATKAPPPLQAPLSQPLSLLTSQQEQPREQTKPQPQQQPPEQQPQPQRTELPQLRNSLLYQFAQTDDISSNPYDYNNKEYNPDGNTADDLNVDNDADVSTQNERNNNNNNGTNISDGTDEDFTTNEDSTEDIRLTVEVDTPQESQEEPPIEPKASPPIPLRQLLAQITSHMQTPAQRQPPTQSQAQVPLPLPQSPIQAQAYSLQQHQGYDLPNQYFGTQPNNRYVVHPYSVVQSTAYGNSPNNYKVNPYYQSVVAPKTTDTVNFGDYQTTYHGSYFQPNQYKTQFLYE